MKAVCAGVREGGRLMDSANINSDITCSAVAAAECLQRLALSMGNVIFDLHGIDPP